MVIGNSKYTFFEFLPYEYKALENYLNKMALKGWKLKSIQGKLLKFVKMEPRKLKYSVDTLDGISFFDGKDSVTALEYREYCEAAGWNFVCEAEKIQIFYAEEYLQSIAIHTDEEEKFKNISKASLKYIIFALITVSLLLYSQYNSTFGSHDARFLADNAQLTLLLGIGGFAINQFVGLITYIIWRVRGAKALKNNEKVKYEYSISNTFRRFMARLFFIMSVIALILIGMQGSVTTVIVILLAIISIIISDRFVNRISSKMGSKGEARVIYISSIVIISIVIMVVVNTLIFKNNALDKYITKKLQGDYVLTLADFNDKSIWEGVDTSIYKEEWEGLYMTFIDGLNGVLAENLYYIDQGENGHLSYEFFESNYKWAFDYKLTKEEDDMKEYNIGYESIESNLPKDIKVYANTNNRGHDYMLISEDKILEINKYNDTQSEEEFLDIIYNNVFEK